MLNLDRETAKAESLYAEGKPLGVVFQAGLPMRTKLARLVRSITHSASITDDVLQQTHFEAWQAVIAGEQVDNLWGFLFVIAKRRALDARRQERRQSDLRSHTELVRTVPLPDYQFGMREFLLRAKDRLTKRQWEAWFSLRVMEHSGNATARKMGITRKSVYRLLKRADAVLGSTGRVADGEAEG